MAEEVVGVEVAVVAAVEVEGAVVAEEEDSAAAAADNEAEAVVEDSAAGAAARNAVVRVDLVVEVAEQAVSVVVVQADLVVPADNEAAPVDSAAAVRSVAARREPAVVLVDSAEALLGLVVPVDLVAVYLPVVHRASANAEAQEWDLLVAEVVEQVPDQARAAQAGRRVESVLVLAQVSADRAEQPAALEQDRVLEQETQVDRRVALESDLAPGRETPELLVATARVEPTELTTIRRTLSLHKEQPTETPQSTTTTTTRRCLHSNPTPGLRPMSSIRRCILTLDTRISRSGWEWQRTPSRTTTVATWWRRRMPCI